MLVDLGFDDAEELSAKAMLAMKLNALLDAQRLTQAKASKILGMPQPKISAIRNYKLRGFRLSGSCKH
ncbi:MAG: helix-turn-helix domain-containing protein [Afipia sp.]|nr:helix-turn-helix domain-containing protein [Afipia sp.]